MSLVKISRKLCAAVDALSFSSPVEFVYNPLAYAKAPHEAYLKRYGAGTKKALLLGMNPGPFGMAQTGVPFGDVTLVREFLGISGKVTKPKQEHEKRPVLGFDCPRSEVSGTRLWSWAKERHGTADEFARHFFVYNYCPLAFLTKTGSNHTPDKLSRNERDALFSVCDQALRDTVKALKPTWVIGVGRFAEQRASKALPDLELEIGSILHPSPASPKANSGWARIVGEQLAAYGL